MCVRADRQILSLNFLFRSLSSNAQPVRWFFFQNFHSLYTYRIYNFVSLSPTNEPRLGWTSLIFDRFLIPPYIVNIFQALSRIYLHKRTSVRPLCGK